MFSYQKNSRYFAFIADGVTEIAFKELESLGASDLQPVYRGIHFTAEPESLYKINYLSRICTRICAPILRFDCHSTKYLYKTAIKIPWQKLIKKNQTFAIAASVANSRINHSQYASLCLKDAIVDYFREETGVRPNVDRRDPDVWLDLHISNNKATISIDTSGGSLHRRGYRKESVDAPMQETLAGAIISLIDWDGSRTLVDPMCGSGTLLCEALMAVSNTPAGYLRKRFGFASLPDFNSKIWARVKKEADDDIRSFPAGLIQGSDINSRAVASAKLNLSQLPKGKAVKVDTKDYNKIPSLENVDIICNPPYGVRMKKKHEAEQFIEEFGNFLKHRCTGSTAYLYLGKRELLKSVGLRPSWKKPLKTGGLDGVLAKYEMY